MLQDVQCIVRVLQYTLRFLIGIIDIMGLV